MKSESPSDARESAIGQMGGLTVRRVAVLGAGVMGAQIAAHFANAGIPAVLYELPAEEGDSNALAMKATASLTKLKPPPLATSAKLADITPANYRDGLELLTTCDLIIEAVAERIEIKKSLYETIAPMLNDNAILASNTSGLSVTELAKTLPDSLAERFVGVHFFNPPRYMHLVELIPHAGTRPDVLTSLETLLTRNIGKGVVHAKDTPNFIGNRIGVFSMLSTIHHTQAFELGFDTVDALTGPLIGRPKSATFRTADVVGLDTMGHVIATMTAQLPDDPWRKYFAQPAWFEQLIKNGALGQKTGGGIYRKTKDGIVVLDPGTADYRPVSKAVPDEVRELLKIRSPAERLLAIRDAKLPEAQFLWSIYRDLFHYCAYHLADVASSAREIDLALRWGYGWAQGPFELWQASGWAATAQAITDDIDAGRAMSDVALPTWSIDAQRQGVHSDAGSYSPLLDSDIPRSDLAVYDRQFVPQTLVGESRPDSNVVEENDDVRLWSVQDDVLILSFKTKMHTIGPGVINGIQRAVELAEERYKGLIIWQASEPFSVGADLSGAAGLVRDGDIDGLREIVLELQTTLGNLKYSSVPTVAAVRGMALGGGCEIAMQCARIVAAHESYFGLVEAGVGLVPAGGGLKEFAIRSVDLAFAADPASLVQKFFETVAMAKVSSSAHDAFDLGFMLPGDIVVMHPDELLYVAHQQLRAMSESAYRPPSRFRRWPAAGRVSTANLKAAMVNMLEGNFISEHDFDIGCRVATVLSGGNVDRGTEIDEDWLLELERENFVALAQNEKTQQRIAQMLTTGKPLRN